MKSDNKSRRQIWFISAITALAFTVALIAISAVSIQSQNRSASTAAIVLGVGSPNINAERSGTSIGIVARGTLYVFDAGAGVERRIMEAGPKLVDYQLKKLGPVFISHLHADHTTGLAGLIGYHGVPDAKGRLVGGEELIVYGPGPVKGAPGIGAVIDHYRGGWFFGGAGVGTGMTGQAALPEYGPKVSAIEIKPGVVYRDSTVTVTAFEVPHKSAIAFGFRIQTADRVIVISGDTRPVDATIDACNGCDILFHELFGLRFGPDGPTGVAQGHTSAEELGRLAKRARPKQLVVYHDVGIASREDALEVIKKEFPGKVTFAQDLDIF